MKEYGAEPSNLRVAIGPAAASCCYEVGPEVIDGFRERFAYANETLRAHTRGTRTHRLATSKSRTVDSSGCSERTHSHRASLHNVANRPLFLYRREKQLHGKVGRLMSVIGRR